MITQISFDVWNTLIKPNPAYAKARNEYLSDLFQLSINDKFLDTYRSTKKFFDDLAENYGIALNTKQVYQTLIEKFEPLVISKIRISHSDLWMDIYENIEQLFRKYPPIIEQETVDAVKLLREKNISVNIASNTNFIPGRLMHPYLEKVFGLDDNISNIALYSDEISLAKPGYLFFQVLWENSQMIYNTVDPKNILHVGDDPRYDCGANKLGMRSFIVTGPEKIPLVVNKVLTNPDYFL